MHLVQLLDGIRVHIKLSMSSVRVSCAQLHCLVKSAVARCAALPPLGDGGDGIHGGAAVTPPLPWRTCTASFRTGGVSRAGQCPPQNVSGYHRSVAANVRVCRLE